MARYTYNKALIDDTIAYLDDAITLIENTNTEINSGIKKIKGARGIEYFDQATLEKTFKYITDFQTQVTESITEIKTCIKQKVEEIETYNAAPWYKKLFATITMGAFKIVEGIATFLENFADFGAIALGFIGGLFNSEFKASCAEFVAKDHVGEYYSNKYENGGGWLEWINDYSVMSHESTAANVLKGIGVAVPYVVIGVVTGGAGSALSAGQSLALNTAIAFAGGVGSGTQEAMLGVQDQIEEQIQAQIDALKASGVEPTEEQIAQIRTEVTNNAFNQSAVDGLKDGVIQGGLTLLVGGIANKLTATKAIPKTATKAIPKTATKALPQGKSPLLLNAARSTDDFVKAGIEAGKSADELASALITNSAKNADEVVTALYKATGNIDEVTKAVYKATGSLDEVTNAVYKATGSLDDATKVLLKTTNNVDEVAGAIYKLSGNADEVITSLTKAGVDPTKAASSVKTAVNMADEIGNASTQVINNTSDDTLTYLGKQVTKDGRKLLKIQHSDGAVDFIDSAGKSAVLGRDVSTAAAKSMDDIANAGANVTDDVAKAAASSADDAAKAAASSADDAAKAAASSADDAAKAGKTTIKQKIDNFTKPITEKVSNITEKISTTKPGQAATKVAGGIKNAGGKVVSGVKTVGGKVVDVAATAVTKHPVLATGVAIGAEGIKLANRWENIKSTAEYTASNQQPGVMDFHDHNKIELEPKPTPTENYKKSDVEPPKPEKEEEKPTPVPNPNPEPDPTPTPEEIEVPENPIPEDVIPDDTTPEDTTPEDTVPEDTTPEDTVPEDTTPGDTTLGDTTPGDTTPGDTTPGDTTPGDTTPGDTTPGDTTLGNGTTGGSQPNYNYNNGQTGSGGGGYSSSGFTGEGTSETMDHTVPEEFETEGIDEELKDNIGSVADIVGGNDYVNIPTASDPILTTSDPEKKSSIPVIAGLAAAAVGGLGAKAFMDKKENEKLETEDSDADLEEWGEDNSLDLDYNEIVEEEKDYLDPSDEYAYQEGEEPIASYEAVNSNNLESIQG